MKLKKIEMETIILYNNAEKEAEIYTCNKALKRRLDNFCIDYPEAFSMVCYDEPSKTYKCPKKHIRVSKPRKKA